MNHRRPDPSWRGGSGALAGVVLLLASNAGATAYVVSSTADAGSGSLRQAIVDANAHPGIDEIRFALGASKTIKPLAPLPVITGATDLNGTSQAGYAGVPLVEIDGSSAGSQTVGLTITAALSKVRGLAINRFASDGIRIDASAVAVTGCRIGTDRVGTVARGNGGSGIRIAGGLNVIGGLVASERNLVSGNGGAGIRVASGSRNRIRGNDVGTNATGNAAIPNASDGISVASADNDIGEPIAGGDNLASGNIGYGVVIGAAGASRVRNNVIGLERAGVLTVANRSSGVVVSGPDAVIGGTAALERNVISGNEDIGVILAPESTGTVVLGNRIGTDAAGSDGRGNRVGVKVLATGVTVGGTGSGAGNLISGNGDGVDLTTLASGVLVAGNVIGLNATGTAAVPNGFGVRVFGALNTIGVPGAGNVIAGNTYSGIFLWKAAATGNVIQANRIGVAADGVSAFPNSSIGVRLDEAPDNLVGGTGPGEGNVIAYNGDAGVAVEAASDDSVLGNSIFGNAFAGIELGAAGPTANDPLDADLGLGGNREQNFPELVAATAVGGQVTVDVRLRTTPQREFRVELFGNDDCGTSGLGTAKSVLGHVDTTTAANGEAFLQAVLPAPAGTAYVSATATDLVTGDTSEIAPCIATGGTAPGSLSLASSFVQAYENAGYVRLTVVRSGGSSGPVTVQYAALDLPGVDPVFRAQAGADYVPVSGTLSFAGGEQLKSFDVPLLGDAIPEAFEEFAVVLSAPTGGATLGAWGGAHIELRNASPTQPVTWVSDAVGVEGDGAPASLVFTIRVDPHDQPINVGYWTEDASALAGADYAATSGSVAFALDEFEKTVAVPVLGNDLAEPDRVVNLYVDPDVGFVFDDRGQGIILDDDQPGAVPIVACPAGAAIVNPKIVLSGVDGGAGDERISASGRLVFAFGEPAGTTPLALGVRGAQVLVEDLGANGAPLLDLTGLAAAIPAGLPGVVACGTLDGWLMPSPDVSYKYVNRSNLLPGAGCASDSAQGLAVLNVTDKRVQRGTVNVSLRTRKRALALPIGPLRMTVVLGADAGAGLAGRCATHTFAPGDCRLLPLGTRFVCK